MCGLSFFHAHAARTCVLLVRVDQRTVSLHLFSAPTVLSSVFDTTRIFLAWALRTGSHEAERGVVF